MFPFDSAHMTISALSLISTTGIGCLTTWQTHGNRDLQRTMYDTKEKVGPLERNVVSLEGKFEEQMGSLNVKVDKNGKGAVKVEIDMGMLSV